MGHRALRSLWSFLLDTTRTVVGTRDGHVVSAGHVASVGHMVIVGHVNCVNIGFTGKDTPVSACQSFSQGPFSSFLQLGMGTDLKGGQKNHFCQGLFKQ